MTHALNSHRSSLPYCQCFVCLQDKTAEALAVWRYADALIEIAAAFNGQDSDGDPDLVDCHWCGLSMASDCEDCPGLLARRALGVA